MTFLQILFYCAIFYYLLRPIYLGFRFAYPPRLRVSYFTPTSLGVSYEDIALHTRDNIQLKGWYIHSRNGAAVLLLHGVSGNRLETIQHAEALIRAGYGVMMLDLRAHGESGGRTFGRSQRLIDDVLTAVAWLRKRPDVNDAGLGVLGVAVGGTFALQAAAQTVAIRAVVVDGTAVATMADFPEPAHLIEKLIGWPFQRLFMTVANYFSKLPPLKSHNLAIVKRIAPRPILIIANGRRLGYRISQRLFDTAVEPKQLWHIPEAASTRSWRVRPQEYDQKMVHFFNQHLRLDMQSMLDESPQEAQTPVASEPKLKDATISFVWANVIAFLIIPIALALFFVPYILIWREIPTEPLAIINTLGLLGVLLIFAVSIGIHELLHAVGYTAVGKAPWSTVKFGFSWEGLAPYAHCQSSMSASAYRTAVSLPGVLLGILPATAGIIWGQWELLLYGIAMTITAGGDLAVLLSIRNLPGQTLVQDHPSKVGCQIVESVGVNNELGR